MSWLSQEIKRTSDTNAKIWQKCNLFLICGLGNGISDHSMNATKMDLRGVKKIGYK